MAFKDPLQEALRQMRLREWMIAALFVLGVMAMLGWRQAQQSVMVDIRPGLTQRITARPGEMPPENVFNFALTLMQQLYRWKEDGKTEYLANIGGMRSYLTESCRATLEKDARQRAAAGELGSRTRRWQAMPGTYFAAERVREVDSRTWLVTLDAEVNETVSAQTVKEGNFRYLVYVQGTGTDRDVNPFGLVMNCFTPESPIKLEPQAASAPQS